MAPFIATAPNSAADISDKSPPNPPMGVLLPPKITTGLSKTPSIINLSYI